jgi:hypothetical protein
MFALLLASTSAAVRPPFTGAFPWQRVPTMCQTHIGGIFQRQDMNGTGRFDDGILHFLAENYDLIVLNGLEPGAPGCIEPKIKYAADRIAAVNPNAKVLVYMANNLHHGAMKPPGQGPDKNYKCGLDNFKAEWRRTYDNGTVYTSKGKNYVHNLSNPECRKWWVDVVTNKTLGDNVHGVFADNGMDEPPSYVSPDRGAAEMRGQQSLLDEVRKSGKYVIFNGIRYALTVRGIPRDDLKALDSLLPHADAGYYEGWMSGGFRDPITGVLNTSYATHVMHKMINVSKSQPTKSIAFKLGPGPCIGYIAGQDFGCTWPFANGSKPIHNKMNGTPQTPEERRAAAAKLITFPLATFLCAAGPKWHLDYSWG